MLTHRIFIALLITLSSTSAIARLKIPFGEREVLNKVYDLPDTEEFKLKDGTHLDLATFHKEFNIAYILPLYIIEEPKLVGYNKQSDTYYDIPESELDGILASQKVNKADINKLPFYTKYGGKIVAVLIIGLIVWGAVSSKKEEKTVEPTTV
ncbi:hypothetical protein SAMN05421788_110116 [Filimonas lacunae]|uniref:Uncharacterized protein n=1 Tax=Filimonas lacunae TaxID=477680 RepID=A0A1N7R7Y7_9BACT|nr:hypothetical protein [Filimonas lacunae]SIT31250.1 hypothetical protein SAMN05421788_110116 [Filimonas lacunae]